MKKNNINKLFLPVHYFGKYIPVHEIHRCAHQYFAAIQRQLFR